MEVFRLKTADKTLYADTISYIRIHDNGCFVDCHMTKADGICAKVHETLEEVGATLTDVVFALPGKELHGDEPVCEFIERVAANELTDGQEAQEILNILLGVSV